ncbi:MAG: hypothetical protein LBK00_10920 [Treponema sp.]|nr:hypothetical protein [Treponema sp.]
MGQAARYASGLESAIVGDKLKDCRAIRGAVLLPLRWEPCSTPPERVCLKQEKAVCMQPTI